MNRKLKELKKQLQELLKHQNIKVKSLFYLENDRGFMSILKHRDVDLFRLNFLKQDINKIFDSQESKFTLIGKELILTVYRPKEFLNYEQVQLQEHQLLLGYNEQGYIIADMKKQVHLLISGLSGNGKSRMVNYMLKNIGDRADILIFNGFADDYKGFTLIQNLQAIEKRIQAILENKTVRARPLYVVIEEMQVLSKNKKIQEMLKELLSIGRHYNIFCIGIIQIATKDNCSFKDLFTCRCSFKQIDSSSYSVCLGTSVEKALEQREFYFLSDDLIKGYTFNV